MTALRVNESDYMQFLIAAQSVYSCTEAERVSPQAAAHDALHRQSRMRSYTRLLLRLPPDTEALWQEASGLVALHKGVLGLDNSTLDKPYAKRMGLVTRHWSGKHHQVVSGINLQSLVGRDGAKVVPTDCRIYAKAEDGKTKNEHARAMLRIAKARGFAPEMVIFDSWYSGLDNLKLLRPQNWARLRRLKSHRQVNPEGAGNVRSDSLDLSAEGHSVHLKGYGLVKLLRTDAPNGDAQHWATSHRDMTLAHFEHYSTQAWTIATCHRAITPWVGIEKARVRSSKAQRHHSLLALRALVRPELNRIRRGVSWYQAKHDIVRGAIHHYLKNLWCRLEATA